MRNDVPTQDGPRRADAGASGGGSGSDGRAEARRPAGPRVCGASTGSAEHRAVREADQWRPNGRKQRQEAMAGDASGGPRRKRRRNVGRAQPLRTLGQGRVAVGGRAAWRGKGRPAKSGGGAAGGAAGTAAGAVAGGAAGGTAVGTGAAR